MSRISGYSDYLMSRYIRKLILRHGEQPRSKRRRKHKVLRKYDSLKQIMSPQQNSRGSASSSGTYTIFPPKTANLAVSDGSFSPQALTTTPNSTTPLTTSDPRSNSSSKPSDYFTTPTSSPQDIRHPSPSRVNTSDSISRMTGNDSQTSSSSWRILETRILRPFKRSKPFSKEENVMWRNILRSPICRPTMTSELPSIASLPISHTDLVKKADEETAGRGRVSNESLVIPQNFDDDSTQSTYSSDRNE